MAARQVRHLILATALVFGAENNIGTWKIESAAVAPWWTEKAPPDRGFVKALVGSRLTFTARSIVAPRPLACASPRYAVMDTPVEGLFQGNFAVRPELADSTGFHRSARAWRTLQTGCEGAIDFHFIDTRTAAFALDNYIYTIRKK
jgi:hypothetical protein